MLLRDWRWYLLGVGHLASNAIRNGFLALLSTAGVQHISAVMLSMYREDPSIEIDGLRWSHID